jgi:hypothetical protein
MPKVAEIGQYRFFFASNDAGEPPHIHVSHERRLAKFWLSPVELAKNTRFAAHELRELTRIVIEHEQEFIGAWHEHFGS